MGQGVFPRMCLVDELRYFSLIIIIYIYIYICAIGQCEWTVNFIPTPVIRQLQSANPTE